MANHSSGRSPRFSAAVASDGPSQALVSAPPDEVGGESVAESDASKTRIESLLERSLDPDEAQAWSAMSPALRRRAAARIELMRRWTRDRKGLTADDAAVEADVKTKRFYQMAAAWKKRPGLLAVGAYAAAKPERAARIDTRVNAALQANVGLVIDANVGPQDDPNPKTVPIETLRRALEEAVRRELPNVDQEGSCMTMPSLNVVRAVITRELNRRAEMKLLGESVALDCSPTIMRNGEGEPWVLFAIIDRGTLRILGHAVGAIDDSVRAYARAAVDALRWIERSSAGALPWASRTRRVDVVVGRDIKAWTDLLERYESSIGRFEFKPVTGDKRFGSQLRKYVGDRVGRVVLRPSWARVPPPNVEDGEHIFSLTEAEERATAEVASHNATKALSREGGVAAGPPEALVEALRFLAAGVEDTPS
jgi:hypothetical protein